jgi:hypothetical protein
LSGISESEIVGKPYLHDELAHKVRLALANSASDNVVRLRR